MKKLKTIAKLVPLLAMAYAGSAQALVVKFNHAADMDTRALAGFQAAADRWASVLHDNVTVNLDIGFSALRPGVLGSTGSTRKAYWYDDFRNALVADAWGKTDKAAVAGLSTSSCLNVYMNGTAVNPNGPGSTTPFLDGNCNLNNSVVRMTSANARAAGLLDAHDPLVDGAVSFSSTFKWDFTPEDGIDKDAFDFIGVAIHEIGHALGFISGVDILDGNLTGNYSDEAFTYIAPADLFRCSVDSKLAGADLDFSADNRDKFFSLDNCDTSLATFSEGRTFGDGQQASHWKDNMHFGILDPTADYGEPLAITPLDLTMFDAMGWNVVPEPGTLALFGLGLVGVNAMRRRRNAKQG